ncbi:TetR/AcrR family transcriptional regulator [Paenactinomyces guangxiensis]|uniref:TetR/AcrR family transcriptional regulator n=1 Tax=Paenactinomyces guangxiensis TaxID=1490290 RepID=A0A7W1WQP0_9BACL|nr:TetR/AcrR family transcriptional regulator [Paenactinomyces guangxiensis]MBA4494159.1 TetR/AcrR family transcriptional regulator [Paenactinomyces guangxiensis]MBH8591096.1 TetR/AcrR family transcriptional regulator [Paenactinomyces guangxiensis]
MRHEKVEVIFQAAVEVFAESGFDQAKMDEIAQAAGVAKGTIYYHFKSKEELFVGLMNEGMEKLSDCVRRGIALKKSPSEQLEALLHAHILFFVKNGKLAKLLLNEAFGTKERQRQFRTKIREYLNLIESVLQQGIEQGEFQMAHPREMASAIFGAASVVVLQKIYSLEENQSEEIEATAPTMIESVQQLVFHPLIK